METLRRIGREIEALFANDLQGLTISVFGLALVGFMNIFSATYVREATDGGSIFFTFLVKHTLAIGGAILMGAFSYKYINYRFYKEKRVLYFLLGLSIVLLVVVLTNGVVINGARRWLSFGGINFQPSEVAKFVAILWASALVAADLRQKRRPNLISRRPPFIAPAIIPSLIFGGFIVAQPDLGTAVLTFGFAFLIVCLGGMRLRYVAIYIIGAFVSLCILIILASYRSDRIKSWLDPWQYRADIGYQTVQSLISVGSGQITGQSFAQGTSKYFFLPEAHTDFAFAVWCQEWGFVGALFVIFLVCMFIYYGVRISCRAQDNFGMLLGGGVTMFIGLQAVFNMLMVCGVMPVTGVPLPFISYGSSATFVNILAVSLLASIAKSNEEIEKARGHQGPLPSLREETQSRYKPQA